MIELTACRLAHLRAVVNNLRIEEIEECAKAGIKPRHIMHALYRASSYSRAMLLDGECAAVGGDNAPGLSFRGQVWFFSTPLVERAPLAFYRLMREEVAKRLTIRNTLVTSALATSDRCLRFWRMLGAEIGEPDAVGVELRFGGLLSD